MIYNNYLIGAEENVSSNVEVLNMDGNLLKSPSLVRNDFNKTYASLEAESEAWDKSVLRLLSNQSQLSRILKLNHANLNTTNTNLFFLINYFGTADIDDKTKLVQLSFVKRNPEIENVRVNGNNLLVTKKDGTVIESMILSKTFGWLANDEELENASRAHKSHEKSMFLASHLNLPSTVVTGTVLGLTSKSKYLHSWLEITLDGNPAVIDYSMNAIVNKAGYYSLLNAKPITKIKSDDLKEDLTVISPYIKNGSLTDKEYLIYRDKVMEMVSTNQTN